jgi:hypothetical protein
MRRLPIYNIFRKKEFSNQGLVFNFNDHKINYAGIIPDFNSISGGVR